MIIRNDDVAFDTNLGHFRCFCEICDRYGFRVLQAITLMGITRPVDVRMSDDEIRGLGEGKGLGDNIPLLQYLQSREDLVGVHGLWHTHQPSGEDVELARLALEGYGLHPEYFIPPFSEGSYGERFAGLRVAQGGQRLEDFLGSGVPTDEIVYLHSWRFDGSYYTLEDLEKCLRRITSIA